MAERVGAVFKPGGTERLGIQPARSWMSRWLAARSALVLLWV